MAPVLALDLHGTLCRPDLKEALRVFWRLSLWQKLRFSSFFLNPYGWFLVYREVVLEKKTPNTIIINGRDRWWLTPLFNLKLFRRVLKDLCNAQRLHVPTMRTVEKLLEEGHEVDLVSNISEDYWRSLLVRWKHEGAECAEVFDRFRTVFTSYSDAEDKCIRKPQSAYFHRYLRECGRIASDVLFVDDCAENVEKARRCGMQAVLYSEWFKV